MNVTNTVVKCMACLLQGVPSIILTHNSYNGFHSCNCSVLTIRRENDRRSLCAILPCALFK